MGRNDDGCHRMSKPLNEIIEGGKAKRKEHPPVSVILPYQTSLDAN